MFSFLMHTGGTFLLLTCSTLALHIPSVPVLVSSSPPTLPLPANISVPVPASPVPDFSASTSNFSHAANSHAPVCNGNILGFDMARYSCLQAWNTIPTGRGHLTFGDRLNGSFDVQLPRRFSGRESAYLSPVVGSQYVCSGWSGSVVN